ncbi:caspase recruitment domain-containing protein 8 isoform X5 [Dasypus novemcinctus]|uniref:caspase recruitment domain-containing protein 8 isoform X5 n=1 Tax=Dasypus novemcinctus TaxID=9361 RepID=UPI0039C974C7
MGEGWWLGIGCRCCWGKGQGLGIGGCCCWGGGQTGFFRPRLAVAAVGGREKGRLDFSAHAWLLLLSGEGKRADWNFPPTPGCCWGRGKGQTGIFRPAQAQGERRRRVLPHRHRVAPSGRRGGRGSMAAEKGRPEGTLRPCRAPFRGGGPGWQQQQVAEAQEAVSNEGSGAEEGGNIFSAEKQVVSSLTTNLCSGIKRDCTHNRFLGLGGNVDVELTDKGGNRYSVCFPAAGSYMWPATNLGFVVRAAVTVEMAFASWGQHLDLALQHHEQWMVAGPLFDITAEPGEAIAEIYLPHFIALQAGEVDVAWFQITHFKDEGMVLEQPARVAPLYAVLENPSFSLMGVLLRIASGTRLSVPITSTTLLYYHTHPEECKFHLYLIPSDASITKKIDEEEAHFQGKRLQTSPPLEPLNFGSRYVLSGSTHLEITPKEMRLSYRSPGEIHPFSKVYAGQMTEKIQLEITDKRLGTLVWETSVKPVDLQFCAASATPSFSGAAFMKKYRRSLQARMGDLGGVLDDLQDCEVLTENEKELVEQAPTRQKRNETLLRLVENKGGQALEKLYESLSERDPYLMNSIRQPSFSQ